MNIFVLDENIDLCARYHCDKHLVKMISEHNQMLGSIGWTSRGIWYKRDMDRDWINQTFKGFPRSTEEGNPFPYGIGFKHHPCTRWTAHSKENYEWLCELTLEMCKEYTRRYGRIHAGEAILKWYNDNPPPFENSGFTKWVQAMPDECKRDNPIEGYRKYYLEHKRRFARWAHSETPQWWLESVEN
tara:strand:- start:1266 stop:1823 length:558 start_codon:yes stop_codon:yes gene_type:complete